MPEKWKKYNLGELSDDISYGYTESASIEEIGPKFLRITDIQKDFIDWNEVPYCKISEKDLIKYQVEIGDIVIARTGNSTGATSMIKNDINAVYASYLIRYRLNKKIAVPGFIDFVLRSNSWKNYVDAIKGGSAQPGANAKQFAAFEINLPPLEEQKSIASILSALDDKIELNLRMNKTLEEMAMTLYKHWFVDFGPFQDGEFVDSQLGKIQKGWEVKRLDEFAIKKSESFNFKDKEDVVFVNTGDVQEGRFLHSNRVHKKGLPGQAKKAIAKGDILYSEIRPKNKRFAYVNFDSEDYVVSTKFMIINPKDNILSKLLYRILTMQSTVDNLNSIAEGRSGTFPQITFDAISDLKFIIPPLSVQQKFQEIISPMEMNQDELYLENQTLTQLRDTLLPKLISGEVRVKEVEKTLSEVL